ncbi:MAG: SIS domain-containing protein [Ruminococcaceae bacterium]|nr:SIS domain-containing protein [Oscillospiraceae bacterium]
MIEAYFSHLSALLDRVLKTQKESIKKASLLLEEALEASNTVFAFGTGHSHMLSEELFYRAGGLVKVYPIFDEPLMLHVSASRSSEIERREGYAAALLDKTPLKENDLIFIFSNSGRNAVPVEMALEAKKRGAKTVCITNLTHSTASASRHSSGKKLYEICDVVIDNCGCKGDAAMDIDGLKCGPTSTAVGAAILWAAVCEAVRSLKKRGSLCEVFLSSNLDGSDEVNQAYIDKYNPSIPML